MQKVIKKRFLSVTMVAVVMMMAMFIPATKAQAASQVVSITDQLTSADQTKTYTFTTDIPMAVKIGYGSMPLYDNRKAPVTIYIDGVLFDKTDGETTKAQIWSLFAGTHTVKVINGSVPSVFSINIVNIASK